MRLFVNIFLSWVAFTMSILAWKYMTNSERVSLMKCVAWGLLGGVVTGFVLFAIVVLF